MTWPRSFWLMCTRSVDSLRQPMALAMCHGMNTRTRTPSQRRGDTERFLPSLGPTRGAVGQSFLRPLGEHQCRAGLVPAEVGVLALAVLRADRFVWIARAK